VVDQQFNVEVRTEPDRLFVIVSDLGCYDQFLDIVHRVETDHSDPSDPRPAWLVTLRAKVGPFARSKRLRMVQTVVEAPSQARFERSERDGREHSAWTLAANIAPSPNGSTLTMSLSYRGRMWSSALEPLLEAQVSRAGANLEMLAAR
jgi:ribosome-associated toxin RatA of RatAB toxin-antitoxin module